MNKIYFTVGPTELFPEVKGFYNEAIKEKLFSVSHRSKEFEKINSNTCCELKKLLNIPDDYYIFFLSSATDCMEKVILNLVEKKSFHFINGYFAGRFYNIAEQLKKKPLQTKAGYNEGFELNNLKIPKDAEVLCFTQNETSTGMAIDMKEIYAIKEKHPDKLIAVDIVTSVPFIDVDYNKIDCAFFSVQKGFGLPPGLGVLLVKNVCINKTKLLKEKKFNIGSYNNFILLAENAENNQTTVTPNIPAIYLLGKVCKMLNAKGINKLRDDTILKARIIYRFFENHKYIRPFIQNEKIRSKTTIVLEVFVKSNIIIDSLKKKGFVISHGYKDFKDSHIRIANFPVHSIEDVKKLLKAFTNI